MLMGKRAVGVALATGGTSTAWTLMEPGSYVARRGGRQVGSVVETGSGNFVALDRDMEAIGSYESLSDAQRSVDDQYVWQATRNSPPRIPGWLMVAAASGAAAVAVLLGAIWYAVTL
jgi:hypothetical protein